MKNLNYGAVGNGRSAALISERGSIDWMCLPEFDSPSLFSKILDEKKGGCFYFDVDDQYEIKQKYVERTNILYTLYTSPGGVFEVIDFMPRYKTSENDYFIPPEIYRYVRYVSGEPEFRIVYDPKLNYAAEDAKHELVESYIRTASDKNPSDCVYLYSSFNLKDIVGLKKIKLNEDKYLLLTYYQKLIHIDIDRVYMEYQRTKVYWLNWTNRSKKFNLYNDYITRSMLVLKVMTFQPSGAVLAALTTSIPETIGEMRNWDYRFCWLRDASMSIETLLEMGHYNTARRFMNFIKGIVKSKNDTFQIMYGIRGERELTEHQLDHLSGYENSKPVRIGNAAYNQRQNDVFGYLLNVIYQYYTYFPGTLDEIEEMWEIVRNITRTVSAQWKNPDQGIWEIRGKEKHFVLSKVMCWVAVDRAMKIAQLLHKQHYVDLWSKITAEIKEEVFKNGWKEDIGSFSQTYCNNHLDASLLLMEQYGFIEASDPRYIRTVIAIKNTLFKNGLMYRYINEDDFGNPSSSFMICTLWLVEALFKTGQKKEARKIFEQILNFTNHLGLLSEDIDFKTKRLLGNFPQAYSHLALINTAALLSDEIHMSTFIRP